MGGGVASGSREARRIYDWIGWSLYVVAVERN